MNQKYAIHQKYAKNIKDVSNLEYATDQKHKYMIKWMQMIKEAAEMKRIVLFKARLFHMNFGVSLMCWFLTFFGTDGNSLYIIY